MSDHRYRLEPYKGMSTRYCCPSCQRRDKTFSRYIDTETGAHIHPSVGRCNREDNCGHHYTPKQYYQDNNISFDKPQPKAYKPRPVTPQQKPVSFIPVEVFTESLKGGEPNYFIQFLVDLFGAEIASKLVSRYFIGSSHHWNGATVFWQIDTRGKIRTGKIMLYNPSTGKRVKEPCNHVNWVKLQDYKQCFFGEHLLVDKSKPIAIVESEKTAVIASAYLPQFIWLAAGGEGGLNADKCSILKGRTVILFPDCSLPKMGKPTAFEKWCTKANEFLNITNFKVSDLLERKATEPEREQGLDIADYLIRFNPQNFVKSVTDTPEPTPTVPPVEAETLIAPTASDFIQSDSQQPEQWDQTIAELETYFAEVTLPSHPIRLKASGTVRNLRLFIDSHVATVKANNGKRTFSPYLNRLQELKQILTNQ